MPQTISAPLESHYQGRVTRLCTIFKVTRADGQIFGFTDHNRNILFGGVTYKAATGYTGSAVQSVAGLASGNLEVQGFFNSAAVTEEDVRAGRWDHAALEMHEVNWSDLTMGARWLAKGRLGEVRSGKQVFEAELLSLARRLQQSVGRLYQPDCDADVGDARCKVRLDPPAWAATTAYTVRPAGEAGLGSVVKPSAFNGRYFECATAGTSGGAEPAWNTTISGTTNDGTVVWRAIRAYRFNATVTSVSDPQHFFASALSDPPDGWFEQGLATWLTGANAGLAMEIKQHINTGGEIKLKFPMPFAIAAGDTVRLQAGCLKRQPEDCIAKYSNVRNHRGVHYLPGINKVAQQGF